MGSRDALNARKNAGTQNRLGFITTRTSGVTVRQEKKGSAEVLETRKNAEKEEALDELAALGQEIESEEAEKESVKEEKVVEKTTGDVKSEDKPGVAKASPAFEEVKGAAKASKEEEAEAIERNSRPADQETDTEEV